MTRQQILAQLKDRHQIDPCMGSRWLETSDIEEAVDVACIRGHAYLNDEVITWSNGAGYGFTKDGHA
jgi:hypothetical protein